MAFAKFEENRFRIDGEIAENHAILVNLMASIHAFIMVEFISKPSHCTRYLISPANTTRRPKPNVGLMLAHRLRRCRNVNFFFLFSF